MAYSVTWQDAVELLTKSSSYTSQALQSGAVPVSSVLVQFLRAALWVF